MNFHLLLIQGCGNRVLQTLSSIVIRYFSSTHELIENAPTSYFLEAASRLEDIIFSIKASNPDKTVKLLINILSGIGLIKTTRRNKKPPLVISAKGGSVIGETNLKH